VFKLGIETHFIDIQEREARREAAARQAASTDPERQKYIQEHEKERARKKSAREKILAEIEHDKAERKLRREAAQQQSQLQQQGQQEESSSQRRTISKSYDGETTIAVRLPDSRLIKREFDGDATLDDVRQWIDEMRLVDNTSGAPYVLQSTFPTRTFEASEERNETLRSLFGKGGQLILKVLSLLSNSFWILISRIQDLTCLTLGNNDVF
jgi:UBX domain